MKKIIKNYETYVADIDVSDDGYNVTYYDFPGCISAGNNINETITNGKIALQMHIDSMIEYDEVIPKPSDIKNIIENEGTDSVRILINVSIKQLKRKRIDITLSENVIEMIDTISENRSKFLEEASLYYINSKL